MKKKKLNAVGRAMSKISRTRWDGIPLAERQKISQRMHKARWGKKRKTK